MTCLVVIFTHSVVVHTRCCTPDLGTCITCILHPWCLLNIMHCVVVLACELTQTDTHFCRMLAHVLLWCSPRFTLLFTQLVIIRSYYLCLSTCTFIVAVFIHTWLYWGPHSHVARSSREQNCQDHTKYMCVVPRTQLWPCVYNIGPQVIKIFSFDFSLPDFLRPPEWKSIS